MTATNEEYDRQEMERLTALYSDRETAWLAFIYGEDSYEVKSKLGTLTTEDILLCLDAMFLNATTADLEGWDNFTLLCEVHDNFILKHISLIPSDRRFKVCEVW